MSKKKLLGLAPLLAILAFAMVPAAAQAKAPAHFFKNGALLEPIPADPSSNGLDIISWGTLTLANPALGALKCENIFSGDAWNPETKTETGLAVVDGYSAFDCVAPGCTGAGGTNLEVIPEGLSNPEGHWEASLVEEGTETKLKVGNKTEASKTKIAFEVNCVGVVKVKFHGELKPTANNGSEIPAPSKLTFAPATSGTLESTGGFGVGEVSGKVKIMGDRKSVV